MDNLPALKGKKSSQMIVDNLSAFQAVRKVFIESVALGKIQQGLRSRARTAANRWNSSAAKIDKEGH